MKTSVNDFSSMTRIRARDVIINDLTVSSTSLNRLVSLTSLNKLVIQLL